MEGYVWICCCYNKAKDDEDAEDAEDDEKVREWCGGS